MVAGVGEVQAEGGQGVESRDLLLSDEADEGDHGQAGVLDLLLLELGHVALGHAHGVEHAAGVADLVGGQLEGLEDGVLVNRAGCRKWGRGGEEEMEVGCVSQQNKRRGRGWFLSFRKQA